MTDERLLGPLRGMNTRPRSGSWPMRLLPFRLCSIRLLRWVNSRKFIQKEEMFFRIRVHFSETNDRGVFGDQDDLTNRTVLHTYPVVHRKYFGRPGIILNVHSYPVRMPLCLSRFSRIGLQL